MELSSNADAFYGETAAYKWPDLVERFDWTVDFGNLVGFVDAPTLNRRRKPDPDTVLVPPVALKSLLQQAAAWPRREGRVVVFAGHSWQMSSTFGRSREECAATVAQLRQHFSTIFFCGKDVDVGGVRTLPTGLTENYLRFTRPDLVWESFPATLAAKKRARGVLAAWGAYTNTTHLANDYDNTWRNTSAAILHLEGLRHYSKPQTRFTHHHKGQACKLVSRKHAERWLLSPAAKDAGVEVRAVAPQVWWRELMEYRFMLSPFGDEIQSPKMLEALIVLTVPIVQRGPFPTHDDLSRLGFPLAVVDEWEEVTRPALGRWWESLAPRLVSFRRNCISTAAYWQIIIGEVQQCH